MVKILELSTIKEGVAKVAPGFDVVKVTLYGSYANGNMTEGSDIDLIVDFGGPVSLFKASKFIAVLEKEIGVKVDLLIAPIRSDSLMLRIKKEIVLYEKLG